MRAIIRCGNEKYYCSPLFGIYTTNNIYDPFDSYVICLDKNKRRLIRQPLYNPASRPTLDLMVLFADEASSGWIRQNENYTGIDFLPEADALRYTADGITPESVLSRCLSYDFEEDFSIFKPILSDADAAQFLCLTGDLHDTAIRQMENRPDGSVYLLFGGAWGCRAELLFSGDVAYHLDGKNDTNYAPYWYGASIFLHDGYVYLSDDVTRIEDIPASECWLRAQNMLYRIIPE